MRLLIFTQKIDKNDDVLGFMHGWIAEFAKHCDRVVAVGLFVGAHDLPSNVRVYSLGKEAGASRLKYLVHFFSIIFRERNNYDAVFVHMNQIYILLGGFIWRFLGKRVALWYAHGHVPMTLRLALPFANMVFTSTASGFRIPTTKINIVGQGIDVARFAYAPHPWEEDAPFRVIIIGRISPVKDYETLIRAAKLLFDRQKIVDVTIVGGAGLSEQEDYLTWLKGLVSELGMDDFVHFTGAIPNSEIGTLLFASHAFVNTSGTGSFDKAVGEAMSAGLPILTSNEAFREVLGAMAPKLMFAPGDEEALAKKLEEIMSETNAEREATGVNLRAIILERHSLSVFVTKILSRLALGKST